MTGSLQIKNDRYHMVISYVDKDGKRKNKWISTHLPVKGNKKKAQEMLNRYLNEHNGCDMDKAHQLLSDYMEQWMTAVEPKLRASTIRGYREKLRNHILPYFRETQIRLTDVKTHHLENFYSFLHITKDLSPTTVQHCHGVLSKALNDAVRHELIVRNPAEKAELPQKEKRETAFLNPKQTQEMFTLFEGHVLEPLVRFMAFYGVRRGEALGLCWDMVDFENDQFTIARTVVQAEGENRLENHTKTKSSYRSMPLSPQMRELLLDLKERRNKNAPLFPENYASNNYVFVWEDGSPITPNYATTRFKKIVSKNSNLPKIRLHDLRHSVATNALNLGLSLVDVQHWMGHSLPSTTLNIYAHADAFSKQRVCQNMEQALYPNADK